MKQTPLYDIHTRLKAKMAPFGGYLMPISYTGIIKEHIAARTAAAIFDTCHMGEFSIRGEAALADLERILSCPVASLKKGRCRYGFICNEEGGVIDDQIVYRIDENDFFMVVNAGTRMQDLKWISAHCSNNTTIEDLSDRTSKIDLQGPGSARIARDLIDEPIDALPFYGFMHGTFRDAGILVSRTGYTGEIGFEVYSDIQTGIAFWNACLEAGAVPAGLGARDTLRLEMGLPLYGHELSETRNPAESGFTRSIAKKKEFIGSGLVRDPSRLKNRLCGIVLDGRRAAREGSPVMDHSGKHCGEITSGSFSPTLKQAIALAYIAHDDAEAGNEISVSTGNNTLKGTIVDIPFYKEATGRKPLTEYL